MCVKLSSFAKRKIKIDLQKTIINHPKIYLDITDFPLPPHPKRRTFTSFRRATMTEEIRDFINKKNCIKENMIL